MCPYSLMQGDNLEMVCFGIKVFLVLWIIFVPIVITARLESIIKLLEKK